MAKLQALEAVAYMFPGVEKCYAIQAGRELRARYYDRMFLAEETISR